MSNDHIFSKKRDIVDDFDFGAQTAEVFDDMLDRSVPFYDEMQRMICELAADFAVEGANVYDLGCSTGTTLQRLDRILPDGVSLYGIDSSPEMLDIAQKKLVQDKMSHHCELICQDIDHGVAISNASAVIMNLTLQFVRPLNRDRIISSIAQGVNEGGCLILVEKVLSQNSTLNRLFIKHYYEFKKRNGYSELEIAQKREALENVLIPYHFDENRELLLRNGFKACDQFFRWYNFCGMIALK